jgi:mono/diheme cytochrome c family protein
MKITVSSTVLLVLSVLWYPNAIADPRDQDLPAREQTAGVDLRDPVVVSKGMEILSSTCGGYCHGTEGRGFKALALRNRADLTTDALRATIYFGRKRAGKLMPAWGGVLSEEKIWAVIAEIVSLRHVDEDEALENHDATL